MSREKKWTAAQRWKAASHAPELVEALEELLAAGSYSEYTDANLDRVIDAPLDYCHDKWKAAKATRAARKALAKAYGEAA